MSSTIRQGPATTPFLLRQMFKELRLQMIDDRPQRALRVALYARVSTLKNQSPEMQIAELREYVVRRGWRVTVDVAQIASLREQGRSWRAIASELGVGEGTVRRAALSRAKNDQKSG